MLTLRIRQLSLHGLDALPMLTIPDEERQLVLFGERLLHARALRRLNRDQALALAFLPAQQSLEPLPLLLALLELLEQTTLFGERRVELGRRAVCLLPVLSF